MQRGSYGDLSPGAEIFIQQETILNFDAEKENIQQLNKSLDARQTIRLFLISVADIMVCGCHNIYALH
jgi:hypothetical protein